MESFTLEEAATELRLRFGPLLDAAYVPGKTAFRNAFCDELGLSEAEAEEMCDSLETADLIHFERSPEEGSHWIIATSR